MRRLRPLPPQEPMYIAVRSKISRACVAERSLRLEVDDAELARRRAVWQQPPRRFERGYGALYAEQVTQADKGCDFEFLARPGRNPEPDPH